MWLEQFMMNNKNKITILKNIHSYIFPISGDKLRNFSFVTPTVAGMGFPDPKDSEFLMNQGIVHVISMTEKAPNLPGTGLFIYYVYRLSGFGLSVDFILQISNYIISLLRI